MIPSTIHYCWFGHNPKPELAEKCIESWKKHCPTYEIIEWNEDNVDLSCCPVYVKEAYAREKWAFVTDYIRLKVVYENGGIYLDTDVELLRPLDDLLTHSAFMGCEGTEYVNTGLGFGAEKGCIILRNNMAVYERMNPIDETGSFVSSPCPHYTTKILKELGISFPIKNIVVTDMGLTIYTNEYFNPYDWKMDKLKLTGNTYSIHHYGGSWMSGKQKKGLVQTAKVKEIEKRFGKLIAKLYDYYFWSKKENGGSGIVVQFLQKLGVK